MDEGPNYNGVSAFETLIQRRDWLTQRIIGKTNVGWDTEYDKRERDALTWILEQYSILQGLRK